LQQSTITNQQLLHKALMRFAILIPLFKELVKLVKSTKAQGSWYSLSFSCSPPAAVIVFPVVAKRKALAVWECKGRKFIPVCNTLKEYFLSFFRCFPGSRPGCAA